MTIPVIKPILLILASLSIIWDFSVFTQPFLLLNSRPNPPSSARRARNKLTKTT